MLKQGILNPALAALLCRFRHTNVVVIADRGFPHWSGVDTVDISLADDIPTVRQVVAAISKHYTIGAAYMAKEFQLENPATVRADYESLLPGIEICFEEHAQFKRRVPQSIGVIRTGDTTQYANIILESGRAEANGHHDDGVSVGIRQVSNGVHVNGGAKV